MKDVIELTKDLVRIESTNPGTRENGVREYICDYLSDSGVKAELNEVEEGRSNIVATIWPEGGMAHMAGAEDSMLVLICHMDTVVVGKGWIRDPFGAEEWDGRIYGRGSCDMKAGLACALSVFKKTALDVKYGKRRLLRPLRLICTVDEEGSMAGAEHIIRNGYVKASDWVLDLEPTDGQIQMAHKGRFWIVLTVQGMTAHASRPEQGADAVAAAAEMIVGIRRAFGAFPEHHEMGRPTVTFGQIQGGYQPYVVPDSCKIWLDCRLVPPVDYEKVLETIENVFASVREKIPGIGIEYEITGNRPYIEKNPESGLLAGLQKAVGAVCGQELGPGVFPGYSDTAVIAGMLGNRDCVSYGPGSLEHAHRPDESVACKDIIRCEKVLEKLIQQIEAGDF